MKTDEEIFIEMVLTCADDEDEEFEDDELDYYLFI